MSRSGKYIQEPKSDILDGNYKTRADPILKCYEAVRADFTKRYGPHFRGVFSIYDGASV